MGRNDGVWDGGLSARYDTSWKRTLTLDRAVAYCKYKGRTMPKPPNRDGYLEIMRGGFNSRGVFPAVYSGYAGRITPLPAIDGVDKSILVNDFKRRYEDYYNEQAKKKIERELIRVMNLNADVSITGWDTSDDSLDDLLEQLQVYGKAGNTPWF